MDTNRLKENLGYVVGKKRGTVIELQNKIGSKAMEEFRIVGFVKLGYNKWSKLDLADCYYKDMYGYLSYWYQKLKKGKL